MELLARPLDEVCAEARELRAEGHGTLVTYSPKVFIPLTKLCRDVCHYCTFARPPRRGERAYMTIEEVLACAAEAVLRETGLLPHLNPGVMTVDDVRALRRVSASMGLMLETTSERLS